MNTSAQSWGPGHGVSRVPRLKNGRKAAGIPMAVGGRRSHAPQPDATRRRRSTSRRGERLSFGYRRYNLHRARLGQRHKFSRELPVVAQTEIETLNKTSDVKKFLIAAGLWDDVERAKLGRNIRAGKGKMRGRKLQEQKKPAHRRSFRSGPWKGGQKPAWC